MRLFVSSSFEPAYAANLRAVEDYARANAGKDAVKWVSPENFHITYAFLGDLDREKAAAAAEKGLEAGIEGLSSFRIVSGGFGVFPSVRHPSVLWLGIGEGAARLRELSGKIAEGLAAQGLVFENRFEPHVTLGRVKRGLPDNFLRRAGDFAAGRKVSSQISSVELMESLLTPEGPVYRQVCSKKLPLVV